MCNNLSYVLLLGTFVLSLVAKQLCFPAVVLKVVPVALKIERCTSMVLSRSDW